MKKENQSNQNSIFPNESQQEVKKSFDHKISYPLHFGCVCVYAMLSKNIKNLSDLLHMSQISPLLVKSPSSMSL